MPNDLTFTDIGKAAVERFIEAGAVVVAVDRVQGEHEGIDWQVCDLGESSAILQLEQYLKDK
jgi:NAD(P)-dependent dehydrogenase (short-subunit alcohol dehydrogenase family)